MTDAEMRNVLQWCKAFFFVCGPDDIPDCISFSLPSYFVSSLDFFLILCYPIPNTISKEENHHGTDHCQFCQ